MQKIPKIWKTAHTVLIYKKGDNTDPSNFRPIALQSCMYKLFVARVSDRMSKWANNNNLLSNCQKGFRQGEGCFEHTFMLSLLLRMPGTTAKNYPLPGYICKMLLAVSPMMPLPLLSPIWVSLWN